MKNSLSRCQPLCGTFFEVEVSSLKANDDSLLEWSQIAFQKAAELEKVFSPFDNNSELNQFNAMKVNEIFEASNLFYEAIKRTQFLFEETDGLFTPYKSRQQLSFETQPNNKIKKIDSSVLNINGFIKGWIVDIMVDNLVNQGADRVLVNGGGDLRYWFNPQASAHIEHPVISLLDYKDRNKIRQFPLIEPSAVATSANYAYDYEHPQNHQIQFVERTPKESFFFTATVVTKECWKADALTKVLIQNHKKAELCAKKWDAKLYFKSEEKELCFEPSKT